MVDFTHINARIQKPTTKANSRRAAEIEPFVTRLNESRKLAGYEPYTAAFVATKMSHIETGDLHAFYKKLDQSKNFGALWHWYCTCPDKKKLCNKKSKTTAE